MGSLRCNGPILCQMKTYISDIERNSVPLVFFYTLCHVMPTDLTRCDCTFVWRRGTDTWRWWPVLFQEHPSVDLSPPGSFFLHPCRNTDSWSRFPGARPWTSTHDVVMNGILWWMSLCAKAVSTISRSQNLQYPPTHFDSSLPTTLSLAVWLIFGTCSNICEDPK